MRLLRVALGSLLAACASATACASQQSDLAVLVLPPDAEPPPSFTAPSADGGGDADSGALAPLALCIATECPAPYATCESDDFKCETNLDTDDDHCGACGARCPSLERLKAASRCVEGACTLFCIGSFKDCNGIIDDGCEADVRGDESNCGACGNKCDPGVLCRNGKCGCPTGYTDCSGACVDLDTNGAHCGACGNTCLTPTDAGPPPRNAAYNCHGGECGKLACHFFFADCNNDLLSPESDGCEIRTSTDPKNCGKCGVVCAPDEICGFIVGQAPVAKCHLPPEGDYCYGRIVDYTSDPAHCGACDLRCETDLPQMIGSCRKGLCEYECKAGWADCDGIRENGCEVNLLIHGANCGACGHSCDTAAGQPCIEGRCLTMECDGGGIVQ